MHNSMVRGREPDHRFYESSGRSSSRDRDRSPMRGDIDTTSNPETVSARIFIGSLIPSITKELVEDHFSRWGNIVCVSLSKNNFGFVQYEKESEAQTCLASGYTTMINGTRITVKQAKLIGQLAPPPIVPGLGHGGINPGLGGSSNNRWPSRNSYGGTRDQLPPPPPRDDLYYDAYYRDSSKGREDDSLLYADYYRDYYDRPAGGGSSSSSAYYRSEIDPLLPTRSSYDTSYSSFQTEPLDPLDPLRPNDVEIVVPNKAQRPYAESIEGQLRRLNLLVDLLFPPPDITPARVISDLTDRHCLFAIFATAENEKHNSLTLNILHGEPQEHRNMPADDALRLIQRNFEDYVKQTRQRNMRQIVPRDVRNLLFDLLEMHALSMGDLDKLIKYLRERQNALVDDQIEQKREIAVKNADAGFRKREYLLRETQSSLVAEGMAVTYPGYNYIASTISGTNPASVAAAQPAGILAGAQTAVAQQAASVNIISSANPVAAATITAYPVTAYTGLSTTGMIGAYGVAPQAQASHQVMQGAAPVPAAAQKQSELQERILNLMKGQGSFAQGGITVTSGVPAPTGVPPPSVVPAPRMIHQQQHQQQPPQHMWMQHSIRSVDSTEKMQGNQQVYNPWSQ